MASLVGAACRRVGGLRHLLVQRLEGAHRERAAQHEADTEGQRGTQHQQGEHGDEDAALTPEALLERVAALAAAQAVDGCDDQEPERERQGQALGRVSDDIYQSVHHDGSPSVNSRSVAAVRALPTDNYTPLFFL